MCQANDVENKLVNIIPPPSATGGPTTGGPTKGGPTPTGGPTDTGGPTTVEVGLVTGGPGGVNSAVPSSGMKNKQTNKQTNKKFIFYK
jgi:hypothetical protein